MSIKAISNARRANKRMSDNTTISHTLERLNAELSQAKFLNERLQSRFKLDKVKEERDAAKAQLKTVEQERDAAKVQLKIVEAECNDEREEHERVLLRLRVALQAYTKSGEAPQTSCNSQREGAVFLI